MLDYVQNACKLHEISQLEFSKCIYWDIVVCKKTKRSGSYFVVRFLMSMSGTKCPPFPSQTIPNEYCQPRGTYRLGSQTVLCPRDLTSEDQNYMEACSIPCSYSSYCQSPICVKITIGRGSIFSLFNMCWILDRELQTTLPLTCTTLVCHFFYVQIYRCKKPEWQV